jgi:hypothetical protein
MNLNDLTKDSNVIFHNDQFSCLFCTIIVLYFLNIQIQSLVRKFTDWCYFLCISKFFFSSVYFLCAHISFYQRFFKFIFYNECILQ